MNKLLFLIAFILSSLLPNTGFAGGYSHLTTEELTQLRSELQKMDTAERTAYQAEMRNRISSEEQIFIRNSHEEGAGEKKYGSGFGSREGGSHDGVGKRKGKLKD